MSVGTYVRGNVLHSFLHSTTLYFGRVSSASCRTKSPRMLLPQTKSLGEIPRFLQQQYPTGQNHPDYKRSSKCSIVKPEPQLMSVKMSIQRLRVFTMTEVRA